MPKQTTVHQAVPEVTRRTPVKKTPAPDRSARAAHQGVVQGGLHADLAGLRPEDVIQLQHLAGNRAVAAALGAQAKMTVGPANDRYEQEADRVAQQVLAAPGPARVAHAGEVQRAPEEEEEIQTKPLPVPVSISRVQRQELEEEDLQPSRLQRQEEEEEVQTSRLQRQEDEEEVQTARIQRQEDEEEVQTARLQRQEEEEEVQTARLQRQEDEEEIQTSRDQGGSFATTSDFDQRLSAARSGGSPLPADLRAELEPRYGADFSGVKVHTGAGPSELNRQIQAKAFTHGSDIFFGDGAYDPDTQPGKQLLAHELTHVVQQGAAGAPQSAGVQRDAAEAPEIQRYTMSSIAQGGAVNWLGETNSVTRPDEGVSGGVFFFHSNEEVVIKPESDALPSSVRALESTLQGANVPVAASAKIIEQGSPEADLIKQTVEQKPGIAPDKKPPLINYITRASALLVLPKASGRSLSSMLRNAKTQTDVDALLRIINTPRIQNQIGRMSIIDAFMANEDRLNAFFSQLGGTGKSNLGNIMLTAEQNSNAVAIDNSAFRWNPASSKGNTPMSEDYSLELVQKMLSQPNKQAEFFFTSMQAFLPPATGDFDPKAYFIAHYDRDSARAAMTQGMTEAADRLVAQMKNRQSRKALKAGLGDQKNQWEGMRARVEWLSAVRSGEGQEAAMARANAKMIMHRGAKSIQKRIKGLLTVDPELGQVPAKPKGGLLSRFSDANKAFNQARENFIAAIEERAQDMHDFAAEIDELVATAGGTGPAAQEAAGKLKHIARHLGSDYGATVARMIGEFKNHWLAWMGALDPKKDPKDRKRMTHTFDLLRAAQSVLMTAIGRANSFDLTRRLGLQRKALESAQVDLPSGED